MNKKFFAVVIFVVAIFIAAGFFTYSRANSGMITVCVKKNGVMHMIGQDFQRTDCKDNESLLSWNIQGEKGEQGESGDRLHFFDGNNQDLGIVLEASSGGVKTYVPALNRVVTFLIEAGRHPPFTPEIRRFGTLYYESNNCFGDGLIEESLADPIGLLQFDNIFFKIQVNTGATRTIRSVNESGAGCRSIGTQDRVTFILKEVVLPFSLPLAWPPEIRDVIEN